MNKAEKLIIKEKFDAVILALPEELTKKSPFVLHKAVDEFRELIKVL